ncbi:MAG: hypothetical protein EAZ53_10340 [Bacteroidetes bacterium]|nr:MAG: hypothetical protein EAZ53_10340 [Bacteroidota bacterium]
MKNSLILLVLVFVFACGGPEATPTPNTQIKPSDTSSYYYINGKKVYAFLQKQKDSPNLFLTATDYVSKTDYKVLSLGIKAIPSVKTKYVIKYTEDSISTKNVYTGMQTTKNGTTRFFTSMSGSGDVLTVDFDAKGRKVFTFNPFVCQDLTGSWSDTLQIYGNLILLEQ